MSTKRVIIVGGGFAGLGAAYALMQRGITPLLLEAKDRAGGRSGMTGGALRQAQGERG